jgi:carbamate kinase
MPPLNRRAVIALGGNALIGSSGEGHIDELVAAAMQAAESVTTLLCNGWSVVMVHGNGPQVGVELLRSEEASTKVPPFGLDLCVASTQGTMGTLLEMAIRNCIHGQNIKNKHVASVVSLAVVEPNDPAFARPTKPIGLFYSRYRANQLKKELQAKGWDIREDSGRGWRPVVPSPAPQELLSMAACEHLLDAGFTVLAGGGGGVPVVRDSEGQLTAIEAVIDKDQTAALIAQKLHCELLIFLTPVSGVDLNYGTTFAKRLRAITTEEASQFHAQGHFAPGSMGPKIQAAVHFAQQGGTVLITSPGQLKSAMAGHDGTRIKDGKPSESASQAVPSLLVEDESP